MRDEGLLKIYNLQNAASSGQKPKEQLVYLDQAYYAVKTIGFNRMYASKGANYRLDKLVRVFATALPEAAKYVRQYRIGDINVIVDEDACDLSLERLEKLYEVLDESTNNTV